MTETMTADLPLSDSEGDSMARGRKVRIDGAVRTIPAMCVPWFENMVDKINEQYPGDNREHERAAATRAAVLYLLETSDAATVGEELTAAREQYEAALAAARTFALMSFEDGATEAGIARDMAVDRLTVRRWRGKKDRR